MTILISPYETKASEETTHWELVASTETGIQYINPLSVNYDNNGFLSVETKYTELSYDDNEILTTNLYLMQIDCDKRLYKDIAINGNVAKSAKWENSQGDKLIKKTIIKSCSY